VGVPGNLLEQANRLSDRDRQLLVAFLKGESPGHLPTHGIRQILLNEVTDALLLPLWVARMCRGM
jgi:hypothetical protein